MKKDIGMNKNDDNLQEDKYYIEHGVKNNI